MPQTAVTRPSMHIGRKALEKQWVRIRCFNRECGRNWPWESVTGVSLSDTQPATVRGLTGRKAVSFVARFGTCEDFISKTERSFSA